MIEANDRVMSAAEEQKAPVAAPPEPSATLQKVIARLGPLVAEHQSFRGDDCIHVARENILDAARMLHVKRDREFVAMEIALQTQLAVAERRRIFALDLDDLGAVIGEDTSRDRAGDDPGEIEDADAVEWRRTTPVRLRWRYSCLGVVAHARYRVVS